MGHQKLREDKTCLNCNYVVENKYCPNCGQENTETRQSFHYLFTHFVEDLTHYDGSFWRTIKGLLFRPGRLTKVYLEGKRKRFVPPVKLYIFISFVTFLLPSLLPGESILDTPVEEALKEEKGSNTAKKEVFPGLEVRDSVYVKNIKELDSVQNASPQSQKISDAQYNVYKNILKVNEENNLAGAKDSLSTTKKESPGLRIREGVYVKNIKELDSLQNASPESKKMSYTHYSLYKNVLKISQENNKKEFLKKVLEYSVHTLPKVLFLYMPVFAFFLWLLHDKKKWYYFDSGVFTLHYFSFLLLVITIGMLFNWLMSLVPFLDFLAEIYNLVAMFYVFFYFYRAHSTFFREDKIISRLKSTILFFINMFLISLFMMALFVYSMWHVH